MELNKTKFRIKCEMGACRKEATISIKMAKVGLRTQIHMCNDCLNELYNLLSKEIVPKPIENPMSGKKRKQPVVSES